MSTRRCDWRHTTLRARGARGRVPSGTSCCWRCAFERKATIAYKGSASGRGHDAKHHLRTFENAPSRQLRDFCSFEKVSRGQGTSENSVKAKFAQRVVPRERGKLERPWECTGGYSSSINSSKGTPYALAIFVTVGM